MDNLKQKSDFRLLLLAAALLAAASTMLQPSAAQQYTFGQATWYDSILA
jgi:hypothetical protein